MGKVRSRTGVWDRQHSTTFDSLHARVVESPNVQTNQTDLPGPWQGTHLSVLSRFQGSKSNAQRARKLCRGRAQDGEKGTAEVREEEGRLKDHFELLGYSVRDKITGFFGVCGSISFDISGCVQGLILPPADPKTMKIEDARWFDTKRLEKINAAVAMEPPDFVSVPGGQEMPAYPQKTLPR